MRPIRKSLIRFVSIFATAAAFSICAYGAVNPKNILMFSSEDVRLPALMLVEDTVRSSFNRDSPTEVAFYSEGLDNARIPQEKYESEYVNFLRRKYDGNKIDVIIVRGTGAIRFLLKHEAEIFTGVPKVLVLSDRRPIDDLDLGPNVTGVYGKVAFARTLDLILSQNPATKKVVVVTGSSAPDKNYLEQAKKEFSAYTGRVDIAYLSGLSMPDLQTQISSLPPDNVCLFISYAGDPAGSGYTLPAAISMLMPFTKVPMYGVSEMGMGAGIVGGDLISYQSTGGRVAEVAKRILSGERPSDIPEIITESVPMFDWRQLHRWNINEATLPAGSIVRFKQPTFWDQYKWLAIGTVTFIVVETLLIAWLLFLRARKKQAVAESLRFASLLKNKHEQLDSVVSNVPGIVWESRVVDDTGRRRAQFVSGYVEEMLGYTVEECLADPEFIGSRVVDEDREAYKSQADMAFLNDGQRVVQFRCATKDGGQKWAESHIVAIVDESGERVGLRGVTMDVTERMAAVEALTESEARYRNVVETQTELICRYLEDTTLTFVNDAYCRYFGKDSSELIGTKFIDLIPPHAHAETLGHISSLISNGNSETYEHEVIRNDGTRGWQQRHNLKRQPERSSRDRPRRYREKARGGGIACKRKSLPDHG